MAPDPATTEKAACVARPRAAPCIVPSTAQVRELFMGVVGKNVGVATGKPVVISRKSPVVAAVYGRDDESVAAVAIFDLLLANAAGAALTSIPTNVATDNAAAGKLVDATFDNFKEVLNISTQLFHAVDSPRISLKSLHTVPPERIPAAAAAAISSHVGRGDFEVTIPGYMAGKMTVLVR
jgi:hypothetical protein